MFPTLTAVEWYTIQDRHERKIKDSVMRVKQPDDLKRSQSRAYKSRKTPRKIESFISVKREMCNKEETSKGMKMSGAVIRVSRI